MIKKILKNKIVDGLVILFDLIIILLVISEILSFP